MFINNRTKLYFNGYLIAKIMVLHELPAPFSIKIQSNALRSAQ